MPKLHSFAAAVLCGLISTALMWTSLTGPARSSEPEAQASPSGSVLALQIADAIGPATSDFFLKALQRAEEERAALLVLELDTPGGLDSAMREMIQAILASSVPVAIYVTPSGARAASAGTYLLYASHIAAMAPATNLGAATPVQIGGSPTPPQGEEKSDDKSAEKKPSSGSASERKAVNDAVAYIRGLAQLRGRNEEWAATAVSEAVSLTASAALEQNVIDIVATDLADLLRQIEGREIRMPTGAVKLAVANATITRLEADWRTRLLSVLTNPNVAYLLLLVGIYGLLLEGYNPGAILPGVVGAVSLLLALYALQILDVNYAGLALIALGTALIVAEAFAPSFGALGIGGIAAFVIGSVILFDTEIPGFQVARSVIAGAALAAAAVLLLMAVMFAKSRRRAVVTGAEQLLLETAIALEDFASAGPVAIHGEIWRALTRTPARRGQRLRVERVDGLTLHVVPID